MKKAFLIVILLVLVVAVSYIKAVRQQEKVDKSFQLGAMTSHREFKTINDEADSLTAGIDQQELVNDEFLKGKTPLDGKVQEIDTSGMRHRVLLAFYKERFESLPEDLTEYEYKIAVSKIRQETAKKYSITVLELNRLREKYKVNF